MNTFLIILTIFGFGYIYHYNSNAPKVNKDEPLIITDYLINKQADLARKLSRVAPFAGNIESYSGFFRVSDDCVRNMFYWYFPAQNGNTSAPLLVWLQGGPGASSLFGLFVEHGPYYFDSNDNLNLRTQSWTKEYSVIYIDNPVGVGFSFTENKCYLTNEEDVGIYLSILMQQFYQLFPELISNPLYITGESYAGKYVPTMVNAIDEFNKNNLVPMNLIGMIIGNGLCDPYNMMDFGTYLNRIGLIFDNQVPNFDHYHEVIRRNIESQNYQMASLTFDMTKDLIRNLTGLTDIYDYYADGASPHTNYIEFVNKNSQKLNAGNLKFDDYFLPARYALYPDRTKSMAPIIRKIINAGYKTLFYSGQFDIIVPFQMTSVFLKQLNWSGKNEFLKASQQIWYAKNGTKRINGYVRSAGNVMQIIVRNAGHMVPTDQPEAALEMLRNFIYDLNF